jgi:uncharacterized membrane protein
MPPRRPQSTAAVAGLLLGVGLAAFFDGTVFHMLLQWHHMVSTRVPPTTLAAMHANTHWDGVFHAVAWIFVALGVALLWRAARAGGRLPSTRAFVGNVLLGAGAFNLVEGLLDHHVLRLHHVREVADPLMYDLAFLLVGGVLLAALGWGMARDDGRRRY